MRNRTNKSDYELRIYNNYMKFYERVQMRKIFFLILILTPFVSTGQNFNSINTLSQTNNSMKQNDSIRYMYVYSSIGILEAFSAGVGYQVNSNFSLSIIYSVSFIGSGYIFPNDASGIGLKVSYFKPFSIFNCINAEYVNYLWTSSTRTKSSTSKGNYFEVTIGKDSFQKKGLRIFWGIGISISNAKEATIVYSPSLKIGLTYNLFK